MQRLRAAPRPGKEHTACAALTFRLLQYVEVESPLVPALSRDRSKHEPLHLERFYVEWNQKGFPNGANSDSCPVVLQRRTAGWGGNRGKRIRRI